MMTSGIPVVCCTQHTRPGWFMTSDHWHRAGDILLLPPLELQRTERHKGKISDLVKHCCYLLQTTTCGGCYYEKCWETLPFDINGKQSLHFSGAPAYCRSKRLSLAVAEEKHLKHMGVIDRDATAGHLPIAVLDL